MAGQPSALEERIALFKFPPMLGPAEDWPEDSADYALRLGNRLNYTTRHAGELGIGPIVPLVRKAKEVRPWLRWPLPPEGPCKSVDAYFLLCTGYTYREIVAVVINLSHDEKLARELAVAKGEVDSEIRQGERTDLNERRLNKTKLLRDDAAAVLRRLTRAGRTDLLERYKAGELSANAAAVEAGFRKKPMPFEKVMKLLPKLTAEERSRLREILDD